MSNTADTAFVVDVTTHGEFPGAVEYAKAKIGSVGRLTRRPMSHARVRLTRSHRPAAEKPVIAQANVDFSGRVVRAQVEAHDVFEAIDMLEARLRRRVEHLHQLWDVHRGPSAAPPWRKSEESMPHLGSPAGAVGNPRVIRRKSFAMAPCTVDEAAAEMELLDYDFHLFNEIGSGAAAVLYRGGPTGYRLALVAPALAGEVAPYRLRATISPHPVPCLREEDALARLGEMDLPFLFYIDAAEGRACVLYRRYDGNYGLITPAG
ncbi:ribosome hibernation promotion factor [Mycolicibacterium iranicum]|uniref:Integrase n=1 Tax=Mycolicibacterium iranicum TaxID=912594 RepID=A0A178LZ10_MYCIR|nr:HPF/RaiA family ribosome-associated protein [Mycolicibacterium iranicum]OAN39854.1 integrase [Mycolicibacterium iranicum]